MILSSVSKHIKGQNWFAIGLEFSIVVFVYLQVALE